MGLIADLTSECETVFRAKWTPRGGLKVPDPEDIQLGNHAVELLPATVLYADLDGSTNMVDTKNWQIAAEVYKTYLLCATRIIRSCGGAITSFDGDRVMGVFLGTAQTTSAVRCALKIQYAVEFILNPTFKRCYGTDAFNVVQFTGVDRSDIRATRTGIRGHNDIVWIGRAANYAAKLTGAGTNFRTWITDDAYNLAHNDVKFNGAPVSPMWTERYWTPMNNQRICGSNWHWNVDM